ncbi:fusicoccadiene synthase, partial [Daldinia decipiens]|uniref:fusicoccadiene synthase n=1 Tax=Daldinia decipiens TaxID=326647 RepID=UPI0020C1F952
MEYRYSEEVEKSLYRTDGLDHDIPLRIHKDFFKEIRGTLRAQTDWSQYVSSIQGYKGGLGRLFSFMRVTVPECLPERLEIISYANEYAFLYDDELETLDLKNYSGGSPGILETFSGDPFNQRVASNSRPEKRLLAQIYSEMECIDPERAKTTMKAWVKFVQSAAKARTGPIDTLKEYLPARIIDAGQLIWFGTLSFGLALTIPDDEYDLCHELAKSAYAAMALVNDLYSWEKEREAAEGSGQDYVFNAIWVIMTEMSVSEGEAKQICRSEILKYISQYAEVLESVRTSLSLSQDLRSYLEAVRLSYIGNLVWSISCPRYHHY